MNTEHNSNIYFKKLHCKNRTPCNISNNLNVENDVLIKSLKNNEENIINRKDINKNLGNVIYNISKLIHDNTNNNILISEEQPSFLSIENQNNNYREMDTHLRISMGNAENNNLFLSDEKNDFQNNMNSTCYNKKEEKMKFLSNYKYNTNIPTCNGNVLNNNIKNGVLRNGKNKFHFFSNTKSYDQTMKEGNGNPCNNINNLLDVQKCEEQNMKREVEQFFDFPINNDAKKNPPDGHHYVYQNADYAEMARKNYTFSGESDHPLHTIECKVSANEKVKNSNMNSQIVLDVKDVKNARDIKDIKDAKESRDLNDARDVNGARDEKGARDANGVRDVIDVNFVNDVRRPKSNTNFKNIVITNVFLGNIPPNITEERLKNVLEIFGYIIHIEYKWSMDKWSYAFVYFIDETCAINAVNILNQKKFFDNSPNHKLICFIVSKQIPNQNTLHYSKANFSLLKDGPPGANLFLYGIPLKWTELNLIQLVNKYGHVVGLRIPYINNENDRKQGNRGFGFVSYDNKKSAIEAFEDLSKMYIHGKLLKVQLKNGEEHLLPAKLKSIYNTNKNKVKDSNNTKTAQSLVSTTDTLKTLNSINSTDVKNPKNKFLDGSNSINSNRNVSGVNVNNSINSSSSNGNCNGNNNMNSMNSMNSTNSMNNMNSMNTTSNVSVNENVNSVNNMGNIKPVHFITNKNKANNNYMCSNSIINKHYQRKFTPVGNCPIDMLENPLKNNSPFGNSSDLDSSSSIYTNTKTVNNFFDHFNKWHPSSNRKTNSYVPNLHYNHTINAAVPNEFNGAHMRLYNINDKSALGGHVVGNNALGFINANGYAGDNAVVHTKGYADGWAKGHVNGEMSEDVNAFEHLTENKYMNTVDGKMKNITVRNEIPTYNYMNNKINCTNAYVDNTDSLDRGKKYSWKKRKNFPLVVESKDKLLSKTFNQTSKMDLNNNDYGNVNVMKCPYNYFEEKNIDKNEFPKLSILKGSKMYTSNRNSTMYSSNELEKGNINICNKMFVNNGKTFAHANEKMGGGTFVGSTISDEPFKCSSKVQLCNANKNISAFLNNIWYNEDDNEDGNEDGNDNNNNNNNNNSTDKKGGIRKDNGATRNTDANNSVLDSTHIHHECAKYGCDIESAHELESCRKNSQRDRNRIVKCSHETEEAHNEGNNFSHTNKCFYHNGDINKGSRTDEKDCMRSNCSVLSEEHINIPFYTNRFEDTCTEKKCAHEKENSTNNFKNRHLSLSLLNTFANENSLNINDYVNKENTELYDMISSNFDNHLDKKGMENLFKQFLARNKENEKQQEWEGQHGGGKQHEKQTEKRGEGGEKPSEKYNSISRLRQNEENSIMYPRSSNFFNANLFSSNFYKRNNVCNDNKNEQGMKTYSQHNDDDDDDIVDPCLSDIYIFNDYMNIHNYDDSLFNFELENDDKNCVSEKKYDNNIFMHNFEDSFNKYLLQHDENNNNNMSNDTVNKYTKGV
ncbi:RNA-binding protein, putative [Plasmodium ovale wallikeri]|uniref:RNA-binding protein, putative n=1 Tax=Plasmodium ovale wallikeri TaxID=864142 RepID=A0A1A8ZQR5_PLAOA|nr:RNA-binding protein, putative [Plasmodium ovale wallikeri]